MKNSTENIKAVKHIKAQSFFVDGFLWIFKISQLIPHSSIKKSMTSKYQNTTLIMTAKKFEPTFLWFSRLAIDQEYARE